LATPKNILFLN